MRFFDGAGYAADQASATDRGHDGFKVWMLLEKFEADRALASDDSVVIERVDEGHASFLAAPDSLFAGFVVVGAVQNDFSAIAARGRDFDERRGQRHDDQGADSEFAGVVGNTLGVVSSRGCDHTARTFFGTEQEQFVERAPLLESAGALQVIELEVNVVGGGLRKRLGARARREIDGTADAAQGR